MKILAIDSSGLVASLAVVEDNCLVAEYTVDYKKTHSQTLLPMLEEIKKNIEFDLNSLDAIAISNGPGSFTGLRIGSATAKGIALALDKPVVEISTLEALAYGYYGYNQLVCPIMDARREEVYTAIYSFEKTDTVPYEYNLKTVLEPVPLPISELLDKLNSIKKEVIFVGDGIDVYKTKIADGINVGYSFGWAGMNKQRAVCVAALAVKYFSEGKTVSARDSHPVYLRLSQAERERMEKENIY